METRKLLFFGGGNIAHAIIRGFTRHGDVLPTSIFVYTRGALSKRLQDLGCIHLNLLERTMSSGDKCTFFKDSIAFICVKPQQFAGLLPSLSTWLRTSEGVIISVMAGVTCDKLTAAITPHCPHTQIIRSLPNMAVSVGQGVWTWTAAKNDDRLECEKIKSLLSKVSYAPNVPEDYMDITCALSGSGIAFVFEMIQAMADGAVKMGLPRAEAQRIAGEVCKGAGAMVLMPDSHPIALRDSVCSPGGTTIMGISELHNGNFASSVERAIESATKRSKELNFSPQTIQQSNRQGDSLSNPICFLLTSSSKTKKPSSESITMSESDLSPYTGVMEVDHRTSPSPMSFVENDHDRKCDSPADRSEDSNNPDKKDKRERYQFRKWQIDFLETEFKKNQYPDADGREILVKRINSEFKRIKGQSPDRTQKITDSIVHTWFSNRRAKRTTTQYAKRSRPFPQNQGIVSELSSGSLSIDEDSSSRFHVKPEPSDF